MAILEEIYHKNMTSFADDGSDFNIFEVLGIEHDEVKICRLLADLLNPNGRHGQGNLFLDFFLKRYFKEEDYKITKKCFVCTQEQTDNNRFIDISITDSDFYIPFEVKFLAKDLENQCNDYIEFSKTKGQVFKKLIYISPNGDFPEEKSCSIKNREYVYKISFSSLCDWLRECQTSVQENSILYKNIHQLIVILRQSKSKYDEKIKYIFDEVYKVVQDKEIKRKVSDKEKNCLQEINKEYFRILCFENEFCYESAHGTGLPYLYKYVSSKSDKNAHFWMHYNGQRGFYPRQIGTQNEAILNNEIEITKMLKKWSENFRTVIEKYIKEEFIENAKM